MTKREMGRIAEKATWSKKCRRWRYIWEGLFYWREKRRAITSVTFQTNCITSPYSTKQTSNLLAWLGWRLRNNSNSSNHSRFLSPAPHALPFLYNFPLGRCLVLLKTSALCIFKQSRFRATPRCLHSYLKRCSPLLLIGAYKKIYLFALFLLPEYHLFL